MDGANCGGIDFAIRFKRGARAQQFHPAQVVKRLALVLILLRQEHREMCVQQGSGSRGAFEKAGDAYKVPAFAVTHSGIGYALEEIYALFHTVEEFMWLGVPYLFHAGPLYLQEEAVKLFPHLRADLLAHLPRIFACSRDTGHN